MSFPLKNIFSDSHPDNNVFTDTVPKQNSVKGGQLETWRKRIRKEVEEKSMRPDSTASVRS